MAGNEQAFGPFEIRPLLNLTTVAPGIGEFIALQHAVTAWSC